MALRRLFSDRHWYSAPATCDLVVAGDSRSLWGSKQHSACKDKTETNCPCFGEKKCIQSFPLPTLNSLKNLLVKRTVVSPGLCGSVVDQEVTV